MPKEIERKFLVVSRAWRKGAKGTLYRQGYLSSRKDRIVRVRVAGNKAFLTVKGASIGASRDEFEYPVPVRDAEVMLRRLCERPLIEKTRYRIPFKGHVWEVDEFRGENRGLVVAEIELRREKESFKRPAWLGAEVTLDRRYSNSSLVARPYRRFLDQ